MEEDQELKHVCKFCSKSFPCGRSLGGHMRSHITNLSTETEEKEKLAITTRKLLPIISLNNNGGDTGSEAATNAGYGLRENPKKTWRFADSSEDTLVSHKFCKDCGKGFHSWKALFGHMKCHSDKERVSNSFEDQDSWTYNNNHNNATTTQKLVLDSQSDNEATAPNRRRRSKRRTRCMMVSTAATSSLSFAYPSSSSLSEVEQEQEEVAMSLMMLSRDLSPWIGLHSVAESSDNNSAYFEAPSSVRTNLVIKFDSNKKTTPTLNGSEIAKQSDNKKWEFGNSVSANPNYKGKGSELLATEFSENRFKMNKKKAIKFELDSPSTLKDSGGGLGKNRANGTESVLSKSATNKYSSIKTKFFGSELKSNSLKTSEGEFSKNSHKRGKFECTTCNKIFHSYQALGGHRASHKKIKGCFASKNESSENSIETDLSPEAATTTESKLMKNSDSEYLVEHKLAASFHNEEEIVKESKKSKVHECPICLKVFPSGQALGGHKRSHLVGGSESRNFQTVVVQEPVPEVRDFLDLNLPAATEEESNSHADSNRPWWVVEDNHNHKQEALVGLMSS